MTALLSIILATTNDTGTAAGAGTAGAGFIIFNVARFIWRQTEVTLPDGQRVTRSEQAAMQREQAAVNRAWGRAYQQWLREEKRAGRGR